MKIKIQQSSSPGSSPSNFQKARKEQFRNKLGMFESDSNYDGPSNQKSGPSGSNRESLPGPGLVQRARQSLISRNEPTTNQSSSSAAEKYRRDLQSQ